MKRKGISPLIAAVLLIAFTMAVASLFAQWAPQIIQGAQQEASNTSGELQDCTGIILEITSGTYNSATIQQTGGEEGVGNVSVTWFYTSGSGADPVQDYVDFTTSREALTASPASTSASSGDLDYVQATPLNCQGASGATYRP